MYYPFTSNTTDQVWSTSLSLSWTKQTLWYRFSWNWTISNVSSSQIFVSVWVKFNSTSSIYCQFLDATKDFFYNFQHWQSAYHKYFEWHNTSNTTKTLWPVNTTTWVWYHFAYWWGNQTMIAYVNWNLVWSVANGNPNLSTTRKFVDYLNITVSELIWESRVWSADEVSAYYNSTKSKYWL